MIRSRLLSEIPGFVFAMSERTGGVSRDPLGMNLSFRAGDDPENVRSNRKIFFQNAGVREEDLVIPGQVHGTEVRVVDSSGSVDGCDALITDRRGVFLCVTIADCMPVVIADRTRTLCAVVHAGWRGTAGGILSLTLERMTASFEADPANLSVFLGPSAGRCCYQVGQEVADRFDSAVVEKRPDGLYLDIRQENIDQAVGAGISPESIEASRDCTICGSDRFHSFRRDGARSGRMMAVGGYRRG